MELTTCFDFVSAGRYPYTGRLGILSAEDRQQVHRALELAVADAVNIPVCKVCRAHQLQSSVHCASSRK